MLYFIALFIFCIIYIFCIFIYIYIYLCWFCACSYCFFVMRLAKPFAMSFPRAFRKVALGVTHTTSFFGTRGDCGGQLLFQVACADLAVTKCTMPCRFRVFSNFPTYNMLRSFWDCPLNLLLEITWSSFEFKFCQRFWQQEKIISFRKFGNFHSPHDFYLKKIY